MAERAEREEAVRIAQEEARIKQELEDEKAREEAEAEEE